MEDLEEDIQSWFQCRSHDDTGTEYDGGGHDIPQYFNESTLRSEQRSLLDEATINVTMDVIGKVALQGFGIM